MRFQDFYKETILTEKRTDPRNTPHAVEEAIHILNTHCKEALPLLAENTPLMRRSKVQLTGFTVVDPTAIKRKSITSPVLTELNDLLAEKRPDLPRRNYSVYGTFGETGPAYGNYLQIIVPFDGAKFAVATQDDFINQPINRQMKGFWSTIKMASDIVGGKLDRFHSVPVQAHKEIISKRFDARPFLEGETVYDYFARLFDPEVTLVPSVKRLVSKVDRYIDENNEIWTEGPVMIIDRRTWKDMYDAYVKNYLASKGKRI